MFLFCFQEIDTFPFVVYNVYYPLVVVMLLCNCFADKRPTHLNYKRGPVSELAGFTYRANKLHITIRLLRLIA